jgi:hypothetical protein
MTEHCESAISVYWHLPTSFCSLNITRPIGLALSTCRTITITDGIETIQVTYTDLRRSFTIGTAECGTPIR